MTYDELLLDDTVIICLFQNDVDIFVFIFAEVILSIQAFKHMR